MIVQIMLLRSAYSQTGAVPWTVLIRASASFGRYRSHGSRFLGTRDPRLRLVSDWCIISMILYPDVTGMMREDDLYAVRTIGARFYLFLFYLQQHCIRKVVFREIMLVFFCRSILFRDASALHRFCKIS